MSGYVDWKLVGLLVLGGIVGTLPGQWAGRRLAERKRALNLGFALVVIAVGLFIVVRGLPTLI